MTILKGAPIVRSSWNRLVPPLNYGMHKGSCGRVAVVGGSINYSGAPYFAATTALRCGADLAYVLCPPNAATAIKAYSPDLCVMPLLAAAEKEACWKVVASCHVVVIGPGIGEPDDNQLRLEILPGVLAHAQSRGIPIVIDTAVMTWAPIVKAIRDGASWRTAPIYLTPNGREIEQLVQATLGDAGADRYRTGSPVERLQVQADVAKSLNAVVVVKGAADTVSDGVVSDAASVHSDGERAAVPQCTMNLVDEALAASPRRVAGQGDLFAGALGCFASWAAKGDERLAVPCCASAVVREAARTAFADAGRGTLASDILGKIPKAFAQIDAAVSPEEDDERS